MSNKQFEFHEGYTLFIRFPSEMDGQEQMTITLPKSMAGKALVLKAISDEDVPFFPCIIKDTRIHSKSEVDYYGSDVDWGVIDGSYDVVEAHPGCRDIDCPECFGNNGECHDHSCPVATGKENCKTITIKRMISQNVFENE